MKGQRINFAKEFKLIMKSNLGLVDNAIKVEGDLLERHDETFDSLISILI